MKLILKNSNLVFQKESEPEWIEVTGDPNMYGFAAFGNQFSNGDVIKVKLEVISPAANYESGAQLRYSVGVCTEEQATTTHSASALIDYVGFYVANTAGAVSDIQTYTVSGLNETKTFVCGAAYNPVSTQRPITVKWYYYKVE